jgi:hypothetical protein
MMKTFGMTVGMAMLLAGVVPAQAAVKVGLLRCNVQSGWGYILGSSKAMQCDYVPNKGQSEHYTGTISKLGVDVGYTDRGVLIWDVIAASSDMEPGALEGGYGGVTLDATVVVGAGANALLGGFKHGITLQPISVEGNKGLDIAAGIGAMSLTFDKG